MRYCRRYSAKKKNKNKNPEENLDINKEDLLKNTDKDEKKEEITSEEKVKRLEENAMPITAKIDRDT